VEEKRLMMGRVIQCFNFREKRGRDIVRFKGGKEHERRLLVPAWRGDRRI
jgi:hypothetical protein